MRRLLAALCALFLTFSAFPLSVSMKTSSTADFTTSIDAKIGFVLPPDCPLSYSVDSDLRTFHITSGATACTGLVQIFATADPNADGTLDVIPVLIDITVTGNSPDYDATLNLRESSETGKKFNAPIVAGPVAATKPGRIVLEEAANNGSSNIAIGGCDSLSGNLDWTLPCQSGSSSNWGTADAPFYDVYVTRLDSGDLNQKIRTKNAAGTLVDRAILLSQSDQASWSLYATDLAATSTGSIAATALAATSHTGTVIYSDATAGTHDTGNLVCATARPSQACVTTYTLAGVTASCTNDYNTGSAVPFQAVCR